MTTYMWNLKEQNKQTNKTKHKQTHSYREQSDGCQKEGNGGWAEKVKGNKSYKLPVIK